MEDKNQNNSNSEKKQNITVRFTQVIKQLFINKDQTIKYLQFGLVAVVVISLGYYAFVAKTYTVITRFNVRVIGEGIYSETRHPGKLKITLKNNKVVDVQQIFIFKNEEIAKKVLASEYFKLYYENNYEVIHESNKLIIRETHLNWHDTPRTQVVMYIMSGLIPLMEMFNDGGDYETFSLDEENQEVGEVQ